MRYRIMMGVLPGYGHENEELTPESALRIGKKTVEARLSEQLQEKCSVSLAAAVYAREFGCPKGGELGISLAGEVEGKDDVNEVIENVKLMMQDLGQSTVTIEWEDKGQLLASTYISEGGKSVSHNPSYNGIERFSVKIPESEMEFGKLGEHLQEMMLDTGRTGYMISGVLTEGIAQNGEKYYEYSGTQNPSYGQTNSEFYREAVIKLTKQVRTVLEGIKLDRASLLVEFNNEQIMVGPIENQRENVLEQTPSNNESKPKDKYNKLDYTIPNSEDGIGFIKGPGIEERPKIYTIEIEKEEPVIEMPVERPLEMPTIKSKTREMETYDR